MVAPTLLAVARRVCPGLSRIGFRGSPTLLVDGADPFVDQDGPAGLACRIYDTPEGPQGAPTSEQLRRVLRYHAGA